MSKEELSKLKEELRKEILDSKNTTIWAKYCKDYLDKELEDAIDNPHTRYQLRCGINAVARVSVGEDSVREITETELEAIKPVVEHILKVVKENK